MTSVEEAVLQTNRADFIASPHFMYGTCPLGRLSLSSRETSVCAVSEYKTVSYSFQILRLTISLMSCVRVLRSQEHTLGEATLVNPPRVALILSKDGG